MLTPLEIEYHNIDEPGAIETRIRQELAEFEKFYNRLRSCRVDVEAPEHQRRGGVSRVRIDFGIPAEDGAHAELRPATPDGAHMKVKSQHKDAEMAVHAAFNSARRRLEEFAVVP